MTVTCFVNFTGVHSQEEILRGDFGLEFYSHAETVETEKGISACSVVRKIVTLQ